MHIHEAQFETKLQNNPTNFATAKRQDLDLDFPDANIFNYNQYFYLAKLM